MVAIRPSGVRVTTWSSGLPDQNGLSPTMPGWMALTRIGASSTASVCTMPTTPPLTVETVVEPGYGRSLASPPKSTIAASGAMRGSSTWMTSV